MTTENFVDKTLSSSPPLLLALHAAVQALSDTQLERVYQEVLAERHRRLSRQTYQGSVADPQTQALLRPFETHAYMAIVDLEATCYNTTPENAANAKEVIEVGWVLLNLKTLEVEQKAQFYVKPTSSYVSEFCTELTGISPQVVENAPSFSETMQLLQALHTKHGVTFWGSFGGYDRRQLLRQCESEAVPYPWAGDEHIDLKVLCSRLLSRSKARRPGLRAALDLVGLSFEGRHHSGVDDAYNAARVVVALLTRVREQLAQD